MDKKNDPSEVPLLEGRTVPLLHTLGSYITPTACTATYKTEPEKQTIKHTRNIKTFYLTLQVLQIWKSTLQVGRGFTAELSSWCGFWNPALFCRVLIFVSEERSSIEMRHESAFIWPHLRLTWRTDPDGAEKEKNVFNTVPLRMGGHAGEVNEPNFCRTPASLQLDMICLSGQEYPRRHWMINDYHYSLFEEYCIRKEKLEILLRFWSEVEKNVKKLQNSMH